MNIQDTIKELGLENETFPRILQQRVNTAQSLVEKVEEAKKEHEASPSEESEKNLKDVQEYTKEYFDDAVELLKTYKNKLEAKAKKEKEEAKAKEEANAKAEEKLKEAKKPQEPVKEKAKEEVAKPEEKSSGGGWGALLIGGVVLVATLGAVNILKNK